MKSFQPKSKRLSLHVAFAVAVVVALVSRSLSSTADADTRVPAKRATVIGFHSPSCVYCKRDYKAIGQMFISGKYFIYIYDGTKATSLRKAYNVTRYPTYFIYREDGTVYRTSDLSKIR